MRIPVHFFILQGLILIVWLMVLLFFLNIPRIIGYFSTQKNLTIFAPPLVLEVSALKEFEKKTGIKLFITYFENSQTLLSKVAATDGKGYDLIVPDDHTLELLIGQKLLKKIDKSKLFFWNDLDHALLATYADPHNEYSIPYYWGLYGIGYDKDIFKQTPPASWKILFDRSFCPNNRICMTDDPREALLITSQYLFGSIDALKDPKAQEQVRDLLIQQKKNVEVYTISRSDNLLQSKSCALAAIMSPEVWRLQKEHSNISMVIPKEGSFVVLDSLVISKATKKDDLIYDFLNFLYNSDVVRAQGSSGYCSPIKLQISSEQEIFCPIDRFHDFDFFRNVLSDNEINELWVEVLAA